MMSSSDHVPAPQSEAQRSEKPANGDHLSYVAAEKAMQGPLLGEEGAHLASCPRCQALVQNMRPRAIDSDRFARWAAERDTDVTSSRPRKSRRSEGALKSLTIALAPPTSPEKLSR